MNVLGGERPRPRARRSGLCRPVRARASQPPARLARAPARKRRADAPRRAGARSALRPGVLESPLCSNRVLLAWASSQTGLDSRAGRAGPPLLEPVYAAFRGTARGARRALGALLARFAGGAGGALRVEAAEAALAALSGVHPREGGEARPRGSLPGARVGPGGAGQALQAHGWYQARRENVRGAHVRP